MALSAKLRLAIISCAAYDLVMKTSYVIGRQHLPRLEPAQSLVRALGGPSFVAREVGILQMRVSQWSAPKSAGGCAGVIPQRHYAALIRLCGARGIPFTFTEKGYLCLDIERMEKAEARRNAKEAK